MCDGIEVAIPSLHCLSEDRFKGRLQIQVGSAERTMRLFDDNDHDVLNDVSEVSDEVEAILGRQEQALRLLEQLRADLPLNSKRRRKGVGGGRRDFRRWPTPETVSIEIHDSRHWHLLDSLDCGVPGVRVAALPSWVGDGPVVVRVTTPDSGPVLALGDIMWRDKKTRTAGIFFEFQTEDDREAWGEGLIEALLSRHALN